MIPRKWKRAINFFIQRRICGFDDSETWSLDHSLAKLILPRLKRFQSLHNEIMEPICDGEGDDSPDDLDKMIIAFDIIANDPDYYALPAFPEKERAVEEGLDLFRKHYSRLWW